MTKKLTELNENDFCKLDDDLYNLIQKYFKVSLNEDENLFNWYCKLRNNVEKQIINNEERTTK